MPLRRLVLAAAGVSALQIPLLPSTQSPPLVDSESLQARISGASLQQRAAELYDIARESQDDWGRPTRVIGSPGHRGTLRYIRDTLAGLGGFYAVADQPFDAVSGAVHESRLVVGDVVPPATPFGLSPATRGKQPVYGDLVLVDGAGCEPSDYPEAAAGNIVLVRRGECPFGAKSELAGLAGAVAAVVVNSDEGSLHGTLGTPSPHHVATFGLSASEGAKFIKQLRKGVKLDAIAYMDADIDVIETTNVVAQTTQGDPDNCVMLGGHSDSVAEGPGINDDGSGGLSVLEVAVQLARFRVNNCVRFAFWSAEEEGLLGSDHYVASLSEAEKRKIRLFMDYDMMASPNFAYQIYNATDAENPPGSQQLRDLYASWYAQHALNHTLIAFDGRSDYDAFIRHGIPAGGIATGAEGVKTPDEAAMFGGEAGQWFDPCYHQLCDNLGNVNLTAWEVNTKLIAHSVATFAVSFDGFPERPEAYAATAYASKALYHGSKLAM